LLIRPIGLPAARSGQLGCLKGGDSGAYPGGEVDPHLNLSSGVEGGGSQFSNAGVECGALLTATPCARLHARAVLAEWGLRDLADADAPRCDLAHGAGGCRPVSFRLPGRLGR